MIFSHYNNAKDSKGKTITFDEVVNLIQGKTLQKQTEHLRKTLKPLVNKTIDNFNDFIKDELELWQTFIDTRDIAKKAKKQIELLTKKLNDASTTDTTYLTEQINDQQFLLTNANAIIAECIENPLIPIAIELETKKIKAKQAYDTYKQTNFPAPTFGATFLPTRNIKHVDTYTSLFVIDIDKITDNNTNGLYNYLCKDPHTLLAFISPSGEGIKLIFKTNITDATKHHLAYNAIEQYFIKQYSIFIDPSGKDVSRLCFLCHHSNCHVNIDAAIFDVKDDPQTPITNPTNPTNTPPKAAKQPTNIQGTKSKQSIDEPSNNNGYELICTDANVYDIVHKQIESWVHSQGESLDEDVNNHFMYLYASQANRYGISEADCKLLISSNFTEGNDASIVKTIESAYKHHIAEHGKSYENLNHFKNAYNKKHTTNQVATNKTQSPKTSTNNRLSEQTKNQESEIQIDTVKFWSTSINDKTGKETIAINYTNFYEFLESQGFYNLKYDKTNVELIHIQNNVVSPVVISKMRNDVKVHLNKWCKANYKYSVLEMLHRGQDKYFARGQFVNLDYKVVDFFKDNQSVSYHFHSNGVVVCSKDGIDFREYEIGEKKLWESQINPIPFTRKPILFNSLTDANQATDDIAKNVLSINTPNQIPCIFAQYQILAASNPNDANVNDFVKVQRYLAHATSFGFLCNNYKPAIAKAVVGTDHKISQNRNEQMGRTGKGILSKAIGFVTKRFAVDGRKFDPKDQSVFENLTLDSKVITVDDCHAKFDFGHFFVPITEDFTLRKMYLGYITIPYDSSPKWYFNTNFTFKGDGDSFSGRQHIIEFDDFFNKTYTPIEHFNHTLFKDWSSEEWNNFYNYAYECDCLYKEMGLVEYAEGNYLQRKLTNDCPQEFIDFIEAHTETLLSSGTVLKDYLNVQFNFWIDKKALLSKWSEEARQNNMGTTTAKGLYHMLNQYCKTNLLGFYSNKAGGIEKYWIGTQQPPGADKKTIHELIPAPNKPTVIQQKLID